jgi:hypothetical protein
MGDAKSWIRDVVASLEREMDADTCQRVLEPCGRRCFPATLGKKARAIWNNASTPRAFVERLHETTSHVEVVDGEIRVTYPECYCPHIRGIPSGEMPAAYCACSVGWVKELFRQATGRDADVEALTTIHRGGSECRFRVDLGLGLDAPLR